MIAGGWDSRKARGYSRTPALRATPLLRLGAGLGMKGYSAYRATILLA